MMRFFHRLPNKAASSLCLATLVVASIAAAGCATGPVTSDKDLRMIKTAAVLQAMHQPASKDQGRAALIDVRAAEQYAKGHIPGAINIPLVDLAGDDARLTGAGEIIVYADGWDDPLSPAAAKRLLVLGYSNIFDYRGGMAAWLQRK